jgi:hypothetical protein
VILVMLLPHGLGNRIRRDAAGNDRVEDLLGIDRVKVVEALYCVGAGICPMCHGPQSG